MICTQNWLQINNIHVLKVFHFKAVLWRAQIQIIFLTIDLIWQNSGVNYLSFLNFCFKSIWIETNRTVQSSLVVLWSLVYHTVRVSSELQTFLLHPFYCLNWDRICQGKFIKIEPPLMSWCRDILFIFKFVFLTLRPITI